MHNNSPIQQVKISVSIESNAKRVGSSNGLYKQRQALVEHPYGTMKRQWGFNHIITTRGIDRASSDAGLITLAYNLRRLFNLLGSKFTTLWSTIFNLEKANKTIYSPFRALSSLAMFLSVIYTSNTLIDSSR